MQGINGGTIYTATFASGATMQAEAFDMEGAEYIAANTSALYGWGTITTITEGEQ